MENQTTAPPGGSAIDHKVPSRTRVKILRLTLALHTFGNPIRNDRAVMHRGTQFLQEEHVPRRVRHEIRQHAINFRPTSSTHAGSEDRPWRAGPVSYSRGAEKAPAAALISSIGAFGTRLAQTFACHVTSPKPFTLTMT